MTKTYLDNVETIYLALGSNLGERVSIIHSALSKIEEYIGKINSLSTLYYSKPMGFESLNEFVNCVCEISTHLDIYKVLNITQKIEKEVGRVDKSLGGIYKDRMIDIDLIMAGDLVINSPKLTIPHPHFHQRDFVLVPLCEIAPKMIHPLFGKSIHQLKEELEENNFLRPINKRYFPPFNILFYHL